MHGEALDTSQPRYKGTRQTRRITWPRLGEYHEEAIYLGCVGAQNEIGEV